MPAMAAAERQMARMTQGLMLILAAGVLCTGTRSAERRVDLKGCRGWGGVVGGRRKSGDDDLWRGQAEMGMRGCFCDGDAEQVMWKVSQTSYFPT